MSWIMSWVWGSAPKEQEEEPFVVVSENVHGKYNEIGNHEKSETNVEVKPAPLRIVIERTPSPNITTQELAPPKRTPQFKAARTPCSMCKHGIGEPLECSECDRKFCERRSCCSITGFATVQECYRCAYSCCVFCNAWLTAHILSSTWPGEESPVVFCSQECAAAELARCQRSDNPVHALIPPKLIRTLK